jgi:6-phospho-beta-glucosidase
MPAELERLAVLIEDGLRQLQERLPIRKLQKVGRTPIGDHGSEHAFGPRRIDPVRRSEGLIEGGGREVDLCQRLRERRCEHGLIERQRRAFHDPDALELEDVALERDAQRTSLGLDGWAGPRRAHRRRHREAVDRCPVRQALRTTDGLDRDGSTLDEPSGPIARDEQATRGKIGQRPTQRVPGNVQACAELPFRGQTLTGRQSSGCNVRLQSTHHADVREIAAGRVGAAGAVRVRLTRLVHFWFNLRVKLAVLGGGGFRTPTIYRALAEGQTRTRFDELVLYDVDQARLDRIAAVIAGLDAQADRHVPLRTTTKLDDAVDGADVVYCAIRVGGIEGRLLDETAALAEGVIGQETTGAGGITFALRTVPEITRIAEVVARRAPDATFINFTNPVGLVTEAAQRILGNRAIGICDAPQALCRRVATALGRDAGELWFDYFGINHLGWLRAVLDGGRDLLPTLLADDERLTSFEEGRLFGPERLRSVGMVPNEYLYYYDFAPEALAGMRSGRVRAEFLQRQQDAFYAGDGRPATALEDWEATIDERERSYMEEAWSGRDDDMSSVSAAREPGGYGRLALDLVDALNGDGTTVLILNVANRSSLPFLDEDAVVEVPCVVGRGGVVPVAIGSVPNEARELIQAVRAAERAAIEAALSGSRRMAVRALAMHPLVASDDVAERILERHFVGEPLLAEALR